MLVRRLIQNGLPAAFVLCAVVILPSVAWWFVDRAPFGGDQSLYASATLDLYRSWALAPGHWVEAMISSVGFRAPGIVWLGQWFVPLGRALVSVDAALLLSIIATQAVTLLLTFRTLWILSDKNILVSLAGCLLVAAAPLFQFLSHEYLVEPLQLLAVAWFLLIMSHASRWNRALTLALLVTATTVAMLAKISSPLYCLGPGLVILGSVLGISPRGTPWGWGRPATIVAWIAAVPLSVGTGFWYYENISPTMRHVRMAASGPVAAIWGKDDTFVNSLVYWIDTTTRFFFLTPTLVLALILAGSGVIAYVWKPQQRKRDFTSCCVVSVLQIAFVLIAFSFGSNREPRYLLALLPYFAVVVGWGIAHIARPAASALSTAVLASVWVIASGHSLHLFDAGAHGFGLVPRVRTDGGQAAILREIVARTCADTTRIPYYNIIAIDPSLKGDWLAPAPADYVAVREHLFSRSAAPCSYAYVGEGFFGNDAANSWNAMLQRKPRYVVTFDPTIYPPSDKTYNRALDTRNFPVLIENLRSSGDFELVARLSMDRGILVFRDTERRSASVVLAQSGELSVDLEETRKLFELIAQRTLGDVHGLVEMRDSGILVHPGATTPTRVTFDVSGKYEDATLVAFITRLPPDAVAISNAGTAGVEFFVDGTSVGRTAVDRLANYEKTFNLKGARTLSVAVDNSDGSPSWDWLLIAVK